MRLTWYGHASFLIEAVVAGQATRIILDPFSPESGYDPIDEPADILLMSQDDDRFHSHAASVLGAPKIVIGRGLPDEGIHLGDLHVRALQVWEDTARTRNPNGMFHFTVDGVRIAHMGDVGHPLNDEECAALRGVDILLAITGGNHTIAIPALVDAIARISPRVVVPMHFQTGKVRLNIQDNAEFLAHYAESEIDRLDRTWVEYEPATLPQGRRILILNHAR